MIAAVQHLLDKAMASSATVRMGPERLGALIDATVPIEIDPLEAAKYFANFNRVRTPETFAKMLADKRAKTAIAQVIQLRPTAEPKPKKAKKAETPDGRPRIELSQGLTPVVDQTIKALAHSDVFQRGGALVDFVRNAEPTSDGDVIRPAGTPRIRILPHPRLREHIHQVAEFRAMRKRDGNMKLTSVAPPNDIVTTVAARGEWEHIRPLVGVVDWPVLRPDGTVLQRKGYDPATGLLCACDFGGTIPEQPTHADAVAAVAELLDLVVDFPFADDASRSAWLAALLTVPARSAINGPTPLMIADASARGAGKNLAIDIIATIVSGKPIPKRTAPGEREEWAKAILSIAIAGDPLVCIDNVTQTLKSDALDTVLTSTEYSGRLLGRNEEVCLPWITVLFCTANNVQTSPDLVRRSMQIRLESNSERPELRSGFRHADLLGHCTANRERLQAAVMTILRGYVVAGRPAVQMRPMGSYERWSAVVRTALVWAGCADPATTQDALRESADSDQDGLEDLFSAWQGVFSSRKVTAGDVIKRVSNVDSPGADDAKLRQAVAVFTDTKLGEPPAPKKLGAAFKRIRGRIANGFKFERAPGKGMDGARWFVQLLPVHDSHDSHDSLSGPNQNQDQFPIRSEGETESAESCESCSGHLADVF